MNFQVYKAKKSLKNVRRLVMTGVEGPVWRTVSPPLTPILCQQSLSFPVFSRFSGRLGYATCQRDDRYSVSWRDSPVVSLTAPSRVSVRAKFPC